MNTPSTLAPAANAATSAMFYTARGAEVVFATIVAIGPAGAVIDLAGERVRVGTAAILVPSSWPARAPVLHAAVVGHLDGPPGLARMELRFVQLAPEVFALLEAAQHPNEPTLRPRVRLTDLVHAAGGTREGFLARHPHAFLLPLRGDDARACGGPAVSLASELVPLRSRFGIAEANLTLGRDPENDVVISHVQVSRLHARFLRDPLTRMYLATDCGSRNGTYVDGRRVRSGYPHVIARGATVSLGPVAFAVVAPEDLCAVIPRDNAATRSEPSTGQRTLVAGSLSDPRSSA